MPKDFTVALWLLKLGTPLNLYFLARTLDADVAVAGAAFVIPAQILFAVSAYRCLFPNRYLDDVVLHDTLLSSTLVTRVLATFAEVAWIFLLSHVLRWSNLERVGWIDLLSWLMVVQVVLSQFFVWGAILTQRRSLYVYEEAGWFAIFVANTVSCFCLYAGHEVEGGRALLLQISLVFGLGYLPWQLLHLRQLVREAKRADSPSRGEGLRSRVREALLVRRRTSDAEAWGGVIGLTWMASYWATLIPAWVFLMVRNVASN